MYNTEGYANKFNVTGGPFYQYYRKDHLGNNREVWCANNATILQRTHYYPSGLPWHTNTGIGADVQNRKYNGKEFVEMHGLDEYDSEARWYYPAIMRTTTMDPLAEKYYSISPYAWCGNNPVVMVDPDGRQIWIIFEDENRKRQNLQYKEGNLYDTKGNLYEGNNSMAMTILETLNNVKKADDFTSKIIETLEKSDKLAEFNLQMQLNSD